MRFFQYTYYFFSSIKNRGLIFTFKLLYNEYKYEKQFKIKTHSITNLHDLDLAGSIDGANHYQGASYYILSLLFAEINKITSAKSFIDYGCGKARAMIFAANYGFNKIEGIELAKELCVAGQSNIDLVKSGFPKVNFAIHHADATTYTSIDEIQVFYFFNPFQETVMNKVIENIKQSYSRAKRDIFVIYINPKHIDCYKAADWDTKHILKSKNYIEGVILKLKHD